MECTALHVHCTQDSGVARGLSSGGTGAQLEGRVTHGD